MDTETTPQSLFDITKCDLNYHTVFYANTERGRTALKVMPAHLFVTRSNNHGLVRCNKVDSFITRLKDIGESPFGSLNMPFGQ